MEPLGQRLKTYTLWSVASGVVFFAIYPTTNWISSLRPHHYLLYGQWELSIPFVPEWIWIYLSMYLLFLAPPFFLESPVLSRLGKQLIVTTVAAGATFLLLPATLGFERSLPAGALHPLYQRMFEMDPPHNLVPSLHVIWSTAIAMALNRPFFLLWAAAIALSTLLIHQHQVIDLVVAYLFVVLARKYTGGTQPCSKKS